MILFLKVYILFFILLFKLMIEKIFYNHFYHLLKFDKDLNHYVYIEEFH